MTGLTGLMLQMGLGDAFAQPVYRYRDGTVVRRYSSDTRWEAAQLVRQAYRDVLRREPDRSGLRQYTHAILNEGWSVMDVRPRWRTATSTRSVSAGRPAGGAPATGTAID